MSLIKTGEYSVFDTDSIKKGYCAYIKHVSWETGRTGIVTAVKPKMLVVQYFPDIVNVTNHAFIDVDEVLDKQWTLRWSKDLTEVEEYPEEEPEPDPEPETDGGANGD